MSGRELVPFTCEECGGEFADPAAGLCGASCADGIWSSRWPKAPAFGIRRPPLCTTCQGRSKQSKADSA